MARTDEQKQRLARYVARRMAELGWNPARLTQEAGLDVATVRTMLNGETYPQTKKREAIEDALGVGRGTLDLMASGLLDEPAEEGDEVELAIRRSELTRANQHKLIGSYYSLLDEQREVRGA